VDHRIHIAGVATRTLTAALAVEAIVGLARKSSPPAGMRTRVIAIDGPGGAGKTTLARRVSVALGGAPVLHTDEFATAENPLDWWPRLLEEVLKPLSRNEVAQYQPYDWSAGRLTQRRDIAPADYVVLEGVAASRAAFRPYLTMSVWVETPRDERLRRGLARDGLSARSQWGRWMAEEDAYVEREQPQVKADIVVLGHDGPLPPAPRLSPR
jgi:uridine kinase